MSPNTRRKIKAVLILCILSVSEVRRISTDSRFSNSAHLEGSAGNSANVVHGRPDNEPRRTATEAAAVDVLWGVVADPKIQRHSKLLAEGIDAMLTTPKLQELGKLASESLKAVTSDPGLQEHSKLLAEQLVALARKVQKRHKVLTDRLGNLLEDLRLQRHAKLAAEQLSPMMDKLRLSQQSKRLVEQLGAMWTGPSVKYQNPQEHAEVLSQRLKAIVENPDFQKHSGLFAEQINAIATHSKVREQAQLVSEELNAMTEDEDIDRSVQLVSAQLKAIMEHPVLQQHSKLLAQQIEAVMTDSEFKDRAGIAAEQLESIMTDPAMQDFSRLFASRLEEMAVSSSTKAKSIEKIKPKYGESSSLAEVHTKNGQTNSTGRWKFAPGASGFRPWAAIRGRPYRVGHSIGKSGPSVVAMSSQQQTGQEEQGEKEGASSSNREGGPFPPPWLAPFLVPATGGALFGYDIGATSAVTRILGDNAGPLGNLGAGEIGLIASSSLFGAVAASALLVGLGDKQISRKFELNLAAVLYALGTVLQVAAGSLPALLAGRAIYGLGIGTAMHVAPLYIGETAPNDLRGQLVSLKESIIVLGIVAGYATGAVFGNGDAPSWQSVYACALPVAAAMLAGAQLVPESARWLALRGRLDDAVAALRKLRGAAGDADQEISEIVSSGSNQSKASDAEATLLDNLGELVATNANKKALVVGLGLVLFQQLSGQPSVLYYANTIFERAGLGFEAAVGVGLFKAVMTLLSAKLVDSPNWGRRPLLLIGTSGMTVALAVLGALFAGGADNINQAAVIAAIFSYVGFYQIGFGPISWLILSEVFPAEIRASAVSLGTLTNFASNLLVTAAFEVERQSLGESLLFLQFAAVAGAAVVFEYLRVPETRGLSLEDIGKLIDGEKKPYET